MKISIEQIVGYLLVVCLAGNTIVEAFGFGNLPLVGDLEKKIGSLIPAGLPKPPVNISDMVQGISTNALDLQMMGDQSHSNDSTALADETNKKPAEDFVEQVFHSPKDKVEETSKNENIPVDGQRVRRATEPFEGYNDLVALLYQPCKYQQRSRRSANCGCNPANSTPRPETA